MKIDRNTLFLVVLGMAVGWWVFSSPGQPEPSPERSRPVLTFLARAARTALWVMIFADGPPKPEPESRLVHQHGEPGRDGYATLNHGRGW